MTTVFAMSGSIRRASFNTRLLLLAVDQLRSAGATVDLADLAGFELPIYNGDFQEHHGVPDPAVVLQARIAAADGLLIASPEYNGAFTPLLKNTIDWVTRVDMLSFQPKLIGLLGASPGRRGAQHGMAMVEEMFSYMRCTTFRPHFSLPKAGEALDDDGLTDGADVDRLAGWAAAYLAATAEHAVAAAAT
jgi:NAD(P)H-dependent FMN reductase